MANNNRNQSGSQQGGQDRMSNTNSGGQGMSGGRSGNTRDSEDDQ